MVKYRICLLAKTKCCLYLLLTEPLLALHEPLCLLFALVRIWEHKVTVPAWATLHSIYMCAWSWYRRVWLYLSNDSESSVLRVNKVTNFMIHVQFQQLAIAHLVEIFHALSKFEAWFACQKVQSYAPFWYNSPHIVTIYVYNNFKQVVLTEQTNKLRGLSLQANYTDRTTAACRRR
jgi:hypothetical protein